MGTTQKGTGMKEIEAQVERALNFIEGGEMREKIDEGNPHFAIGYLVQSIRFIAEAVEKEKAATA